MRDALNSCFLGLSLSGKYGPPGVWRTVKQIIHRFGERIGRPLPSFWGREEPIAKKNSRPRRTEWQSCLYLQRKLFEKTDLVQYQMRDDLQYRSRNNILRYDYCSMASLVYLRCLVEQARPRRYVQVGCSHHLRELDGNDHLFSRERHDPRNVRQGSSESATARHVCTAKARRGLGSRQQRSNARDPTRAQALRRWLTTLGSFGDAQASRFLRLTTAPVFIRKADDESREPRSAPPPARWFTAGIYCRDEDSPFPHVHFSMTQPLPAPTLRVTPPSILFPLSPPSAASTHIFDHHRSLSWREL